jgi:hypothetical protein
VTPSSTNTQTATSTISPTPTVTRKPTPTRFQTPMPPPTLILPQQPTATPCSGYFCDTGLQDKPAGWQLAVTAGWLSLGFVFGIFIIYGRFDWLTNRRKHR